MEYFVIINGVQSGPLSKDRLMTAGIQPDSYVWRQGLADWVKADTLPELADIFMGIPLLADMRVPRSRLIHMQAGLTVCRSPLMAVMVMATHLRIRTPCMVVPTNRYLTPTGCPGQL